MPLVMLNKTNVDRGRKVREIERLRIADRRHRYPERKTGKRKPKPPGDFIFWDGESPKDTGYSLFGNSVGMFICHPFLSTEECLQLIYDAEIANPDAIHIGFGFNLDVSFIIKDLPRRQLTAIHNTGRTVWGDWQLEHIPHKWFRVKRGKVTAKIYDVHSFCAGAYVPSLAKFGVGSPEQLRKLAEQKARRAEFTWAEMPVIKPYWSLELELGPLLGDAIRERLERASYVPRSWHGPGSVARMAFQRHCVYDAMTRCPTEVRTAARYAFIGGRFNQFLIGWMQQEVYEADIRSAYPYFATMLPNLKRGKWRRGCKYESGKFAVYHIRYESAPNSLGLYPLPKRMPNHMGVTWPHRVEGWFWAPEAELVKDDSDATFIEALIFDEDDPTDRPFAFLADYYRRRKDADYRGDPIGYTFKIIINAIYGQLAQRAGWDRKKNRAPKTHQLEWAGFITSGCRAAVYKAAVACGDKLVSINTDSVQALCPIPVEEGKELGQWEVKKYSDGVMWQAGIYFLRDELGYDPALGYGWNKAKTRGIPKGSYQPEDLIIAMDANEPLRLTKHNFIPYTLADSGRWDELNTWADEDCVYRFGGNGFRRHGHDNGTGRLAGRWCATHCKGGTVHRTGLLSLTNGVGTDIWSQPHYLPWIDGPDPIIDTMDDLLAWDISTIDVESEWMLEYRVGA
jgi:hypothetical protein